MYIYIYIYIYMYIILSILKLLGVQTTDRLVMNEWGTLAFLLLFVTNSMSRFCC